ncbi:hypothetical protein SDC9_129967 [bioreactor metagenome]|uniref:Uncharacterized protein n=1 Tax=bioreactor metagenome TaxID=1076179 RepID=A0A645D1A3_9ZZZZ
MMPTSGAYIQRHTEAARNNGIMVGMKYTLRKKLDSGPLRLFTNSAKPKATEIPTGTVMETYLRILVNEITKSLDFSKLT